jgi:hypothetical protein
MFLRIDNIIFFKIIFVKHSMIGVVLTKDLSYNITHYVSPHFFCVSAQTHSPLCVPSIATLQYPLASAHCSDGHFQFNFELVSTDFLTASSVLRLLKLIPLALLLPALCLLLDLVVLFLL